MVDDHTQEEWDYLVIGGGCAGYAGAIYAARFMLKTLVIAKEKGGLLATTHIVENYPAIVSITGWDLMDQFEKHVKDYDVPIVVDEVASIQKKEDGLFHATTVSGNVYRAKTVLLATGNNHRKLNVPGEDLLYSKGVSYCATCDAPLYKKKTCAIVGGSDSAVKESLILAQHAAKVYILYRGEKVRPEPINLKRMMEMDNIEVINHVNVKEFVGDVKLQHVVLDREYNGSTILPLDGCFIDIGFLPQNTLAKQLGVALNEKGEIVRDEVSRTNVPGVFAAGDVCNTPWKQGIISAAEGSVSANSANDYIGAHFKR
jgi:thioredoxin reductase (NADPH)